ncbi:hypothetical protein [Nocardia iowensis]|uniref:Uncharacterized protein n=1 Tax=Nocardia iowensis TaxID=204891 RepID=A0ABX8RXT7_NOCIO|nr:hypothetical protein [Nocardia iowensis]QXN94363.1 hypothetical protein KV110_15670 [Nocardia iowensis]
MEANERVSKRRVLVLGRTRQALDNILERLREHGIAAQGSLRPEQADSEFDAREFDLIVFGSGAIGPVTERLRRAFARRNPAVNFLDALAPIAVRQIIAAVSARREVLADFTAVAIDSGVRIGATVREPCTVTVTLYRIVDGSFVVDELNKSPVEAGRYELTVAAETLSGGYALLVTVGEDEFHVHRLPESVTNG